MSDLTTADLPCIHEDFDVDMRVFRITGSEGILEGFATECKVFCKSCRVRFQWVGLPIAAANADSPTVDLSGTELRAPLEPLES